MPRGAKPDWEVSTVKASDPDGAQIQHFTIRGRHISLLDTTVEQFLLLGYGVQKAQLAGLPEWAKTVRWDVDGVPDVQGEPSWKQLQGMMQSILTERFHLRLHHEQREMGVFALTVAKSGNKMTVDTSDPNGWLEQRNSEDAGLHVENLKNASLEDLRAVLQFYVNRPIVDQTQLKGRYDLKLQWTKDDATTPSADAPPGLFTAIQEQIGLKLEPVRAPTDTLVIEAVEKPNAN